MNAERQDYPRFCRECDAPTEAGNPLCAVCAEAEFQAYKARREQALQWKPTKPADERLERIMLGIVILLGIVLAVVGVLGANTHLAPDCPGPTLECFNAANATIQAEVQP